MTKCPKYDLKRPDFMAPSPRVSVAKGLWVLEEDSSLGLGEEDEDPVSALDPDAKGYRYYESEKVLGKLYRAIDEKNFLAELQGRARELEATDGFNQTLINRLWGYVKSQTRLIKWDHYLEWAREIKEAWVLPHLLLYLVPLQTVQPNGRLITYQLRNATSQYHLPIQH